MGIETAAIAATLLGTAASAYGAIQQGNAQAAAAHAKANQDAYNAQVAGFNAQVADDAQAQKTQAIERQGTLRLGAQRAAMGAAGVTLDSGSALDVQSATTADTARQAATSQAQGALTAYGYRTQQQNFVDQSGLDAASASNATTAGYMGASSTILGSAGQVAMKWYEMNGPTPTEPSWAGNRTGPGMGFQLGGLY